MKKLNPLKLNKRGIDDYYKVFSKFSKKSGNWDLKLDQNSLIFVDYFISNAHKTTKKGDFSFDVSTIGGKGKISYIDFVIAGAGSFLAKFWIKKAGGKIFNKKFSGIDKATVITTKKGGMFSPWIWVEKHLLNGEEDSVLTKFNYFLKSKE